MAKASWETKIIATQTANVYISAEQVDTLYLA
jgi:hypothetical protein